MAQTQNEIAVILCIQANTNQTMVTKYPPIINKLLMLTDTTVVRNAVHKLQINHCTGLSDQITYEQNSKYTHIACIIDEDVVAC